MTTSRIAAVLVGLAAFAGSFFVQAQEYPSRPIKVVSNLAAGATPDIMIRAMAPFMQEVLGQPILMDNQPGASGRL